MTHVYNDGTIYNIKNKRINGSLNTTGYLYIQVKENNKRKVKLIHRLVAEKYIPNPENKPQVNHIDGNKLNNNASNLEWVTPKQNITHAITTGLRDPKRKTERTITAGRNAGLSRRKLSLTDVVITKFLYSIGKTQQYLADCTGLKRNSISDIINNKRYPF